MMRKDSELHKLEYKKRQWDEGMRGFDKFLNSVNKEAKQLLTDMMNGLMYNKKEKDKGMLWVQQIFWWLKIFFVFFAVKGFTYWLTGR